MSKLDELKDKNMKGGGINIDEEKNKILIQLKYKSFDLINNLYTYEGYIQPYGRN